MENRDIDQKGGIKKDMALNNHILFIWLDDVVHWATEVGSGC